MAADLETLTLRIEASNSRFEQQMNKINRAANKGALKAENRFKKMTRNMNNSVSKISLFNGGIVGGIGGALGVREITRFADQWTAAADKIASASQISGLQGKGLSALKKDANEAKVVFGEYVSLYSKILMSSKGIVKSQSDVSRASMIVAKSFKAGGAAASEQSSGILQLGQALASGILGGEELRTLRETAPLIAKLIATEFKTGIGGLKKLGAEGLLTSDRVIKAILSGEKKIQAAFDVRKGKHTERWDVIKNNLTQYIGVTFEAIGATDAINGILDVLAGKIGSMANAAAAAGLVLIGAFSAKALLVGVAALANPFIAAAAAVGIAAYAITEFQGTVITAEGATAEFGDVAATIWGDIKSAGVDASEQIAVAFSLTTDSINAGLQSNKKATNSFSKELLKSFSIIGSTIIGIFKTVFDVVVNTLTRWPSAVADYAVQAMNGMISIIESGLNKVIEKLNSVAKVINSTSAAKKIGFELFTIPEVDLGRISNVYAYSGKVSSEAFKKAFTDNFDPHLIENYLKDAVKRTEFANSLDPFGGAGDDVNGDEPDRKIIKFTPKKKKGKKTPAEKFDSDIEQIKARTATIIATTEAQAALNPLINDYEYAITKAEAVQRLLNEAKKAGLEITPELRSRIGELAEGYARATVAQNKLTQAQDKSVEKAKEFNSLGKDVFKGFISDIKNGTSVVDALNNALGKISDKLLDMAIDNLFANALGGSDYKGGSFLTSLFSAGSNGATGPPTSIIGKRDGGVIKLARGGKIRGPGTGTSDSVPGYNMKTGQGYALSNGEGILNFKGMENNPGLLDKMNNGLKVQGYANGGVIGGGSYGQSGKVAQSFKGGDFFVNIETDNDVGVEQQQRQSGFDRILDVKISKALKNGPASKSTMAGYGVKRRAVQA